MKLTSQMPPSTSFTPTAGRTCISLLTDAAASLWPGARPSRGIPPPPLQHRVGSDSGCQCVGTQESMAQAIRSNRPGRSVGYVGVPHGVELNGEKLFYARVHLHGGPAPVRRYLPELI